jgi:hypothetical protein
MPLANEPVVANKLSSDFNSLKSPVGDSNHFYHSFEQSKPQPKAAVA